MRPGSGRVPRSGCARAGDVDPLEVMTAVSEDLAAVEPQLRLLMIRSSSSSTESPVSRNQAIRDMFLPGRSSSPGICSSTYCLCKFCICLHIGKHRLIPLFALIICRLACHQTHHTKLVVPGCIELFPEFRTESGLAIKMFDIILARLNVLLGAVQVIVMSSYSFDRSKHLMLALKK